MEMRSLFVVSLPRSLSTTLYHASSQALRLREPSWTSGGEILNRERAKKRRRSRMPDARFTVRESQPVLFAQFETLLGERVERFGFAYKDVVQPFVIANWLGPADFCVLKVRRDIAEVAYSMIGRRWDYPADAASLHLTQPRAVIEGLLRAESVLEAIPGVTIDYTDALTSHEPLRSALELLYPDVTLSPISYIDRKFIRTRARLEDRRRDSVLFHQLRDLVTEVRTSMLPLVEPAAAIGRLSAPASR